MCWCIVESARLISWLIGLADSPWVAVGVGDDSPCRRLPCLGCCALLHHPLRPPSALTVVMLLRREQPAAAISREAIVTATDASRDSVLRLHSRPPLSPGCCVAMPSPLRSDGGAPVVSRHQQCHRHRRPSPGTAPQLCAAFASGPAAAPSARAPNRSRTPDRKRGRHPALRDNPLRVGDRSP